MNETIIIKIPSPAPLSSTDEISDTAVPSQKMEWDENARLHDKEYADQSEKYISLAQTLPLPEILPAPGGSPNSDLDDSARLLSNAITKLVHKNSHKNNGETELYYLMSKSTPGEIDKIGITSYPNKRYSAAKMCAD